MKISDYVKDFLAVALIISGVVATYCLMFGGGV